MRQEIAHKWAEALESGEYTQGAYSLAVEGADGGAEHCCLGVLCELAIADGVDVPKAGERYSDDRVDGVLYKYGAEQAESLLPDEVMEWSGILTGGGSWGDGHNLAQYNDDGFPFSKIAAIIRDNADAL